MWYVENCCHDTIFMCLESLERIFRKTLYDYCKYKFKINCQVGNPLGELKFGIQIFFPADIWSDIDLEHPPLRKKNRKLKSWKGDISYKIDTHSIRHKVLKLHLFNM